ncbi:kAP P-loop domain protein [Clostridium sp. CAG:768]|nr:kAP P-loop domain protein [Clostridium sp. CAG:768]
MTKNLFLQDSNNDHNTKDSFGIHTKIAETITDIAKNETLLKSSFNLGLFGSWGSGKSYIVDKIISNLKEDYITFYVDVWKYVGHPLMRSILFDIDSQLKEKQLDVYKDGYIDKNKETLEKKLYAESEFNEEIKLDWQEIWQKIKPILISLLIISGIILIISMICYFNGNSWLKALSIPIFSGLGFVTAFCISIKITAKESCKNCIL